MTAVRPLDRHRGVTSPNSFRRLHFDIKCCTNMAQREGQTRVEDCCDQAQFARCWRQAGQSISSVHLPLLTLCPVREGNDRNRSRLESEAIFSCCNKAHTPTLQLLRQSSTAGGTKQPVPNLRGEETICMVACWTAVAANSRNREGEVEASAFGVRGFGAGLSAHFFRDPFNDGKPETVALARLVALESVELHKE